MERSERVGSGGNVLITVIPRSATTVITSLCKPPSGTSAFGALDLEHPGVEGFLSSPNISKHSQVTRVKRRSCECPDTQRQLATHPARNATLRTEPAQTSPSWLNRTLTPIPPMKAAIMADPMPQRTNQLRLVSWRAGCRGGGVSASLWPWFCGGEGWLGGNSQ
jgi:hypothetical protein